MKLKLNDKVVIISGKDKGKTGKITKILSKKNQIIVEKVNIRTKHIKRKNEQKAGEKIQYEAPIDASNAMLIDPKTNKRTRIGYVKDKSGKKERISKKSKEILLSNNNK